MNNFGKNLKSLRFKNRNFGETAPQGMDTDSMIKFKGDYLKDYLATNNMNALAEDELGSFLSDLSSAANPSFFAEGGGVDDGFAQWFAQFTPEGQQGMEYSPSLPYDYYAYYQNHVLTGETTEVVPELISQYSQEQTDMSMQQEMTAPQMNYGGHTNVSDYVARYKDLMANRDSDAARMSNTVTNFVHKLQNPVTTISNAKSTYTDPEMQSLWEQYQAELGKMKKGGELPSFEKEGEVTKSTVPAMDYDTFKSYMNRLYSESPQYTSPNYGSNNNALVRQVYSGSYAPANFGWLTGRQPQGRMFNILPYNANNTIASKSVEERNWLGRPKRITTTFQHRGDDSGFAEWLKTRNANNANQGVLGKANTNVVPVSNPAVSYPSNAPEPSKNTIGNIYPIARNGMNFNKNPFSPTGILKDVDYEQILNIGQGIEDPYATTEIEQTVHNPFNVSDYADWGLAAMSGISSIGEALEARKLQKQINERMTGDALTPSFQGSRGTWTTNQGYFRPDQHVPIQFKGFNAGRIGGGAQYKEGGEYEMTDAEIKEFIKKGGKVEYL